MAEPVPIPAEVLTGVRAGDPAAMADLCARCGGSVLAFCEAVCGPDLAPRAAAEAFARFRAAVAAAEDPDSLDAEGLLLGATRHAAASLAPVEAPGGGRMLGRARRRGGEVHAIVPTLLAARAAGGLGQPDQDRLARHLERCSSCRDVEAAFDEAERRFAAADPAPPPPELVGALVTSMAAAVPEAGQPASADAEVEPQEPGAADPGEAIEAPTESVDLAGAEASEDGADEDDGWTDEHDLPERDAGEPGPGAAFFTARLPQRDGIVAVDPDPELDHILDAPDEDDETVAAAPIAIRGHPEATAPATAAAGSRLGRPLAILLPLGVVLLGALAAMAVAGVFGGDDAQPARSAVEAPLQDDVRAPITTPSQLDPGKTAKSAATPKRKRTARRREKAATRTQAAAPTTTDAGSALTTPTPRTVDEPEATEPSPAPAPEPVRRRPAATTPERPTSATKVPQDEQPNDPDPAQAPPTFEPAPAAP